MAQAKAATRGDAVRDADRAGSSAAGRLSRPCPDHPACTVYQITPRRSGPVVHVRTLSAMQQPWRVADARVPAWRAGLKRALKIIYPPRKKSQNSA